MSDTIPYLLEDFKFAFIDESGNFGFDFDNAGTSTHFIISAVVILPEHLNIIGQKLEEIRKKYFQNGEMKFHNLNKKNKGIRIFQIISEINNLPFYIVSFICDKRVISEDSGLRHKKPFIKYLNNMLIKELKVIYNSLDIYADSHGSKEFIKSFVRYFYSNPNYGNSIFEPYKIQFVDSKANIYVQLSDMICGIISTGYNQSDISKNFSEYMNLLRNKILKIDEWPVSYDNYIKRIDLIDSSEFDKNIAEISLKLCIKFVTDYSKTKDSELMEQVAVIKYLMSKLHYNNVNFTSSKELKKHLTELFNKDFNSRYFMSIIAKLRDNGVIISSSPKGYKIPVSEKDVYSYSNHSMSVIIPMADRLKKCRNRILSITDKKLDIFDSPEYSKFIKLFD